MFRAGRSAREFVAAAGDENAADDRNEPRGNEGKRAEGNQRGAALAPARNLHDEADDEERPRHKDGREEPRGLFDPDIQAASLDHAMWFHRPQALDGWLLYAQDSPSSSGSRGFSRGLLYARDGTLIASVAQEGLVRLKRQPAK